MAEKLPEPRKRPRWLFVDAAAVYGGHEAMLLQILAQLERDDRIEIALLARQASRLAELAGPCVDRLPELLDAPATTPSLLGRLRQMLRDAAILRRTLRTLSPELCVIATGFLSSQLPQVFVSLLLGRKVFVYVPITDSFQITTTRLGRLKDAFIRRTLARRVDGWIVLTPQQAADFRRWARPKGSVMTIPNVVSAEIEHCHPTPSTAPPDSPLRVLVLGRLDAQQKGLDWLLDYLEEAGAACANVLITLAGTGPYQPEIERRLRDSAVLRSRIRLLGWAEAKPTVLDHDVLLLPSRFEGVPLVMLEAMALGRPVVASDLPGTRDYLPADCLFPVGELARGFAILDGLQEPAERRRIAERNRHRFEQTASGAAFASAVREFVDAMLPHS